jgi:hypothetical protein
MQTVLDILPSEVLTEICLLVGDKVKLRSVCKALRAKVDAELVTHIKCQSVPTRHVLARFQRLASMRLTARNYKRLGNLTMLRQLDIEVVHIDAITPRAGLTALRRLTALQHLNMSNNILPRRTGLDLISRLTALRHLEMRDVYVPDLTPLSCLTALQHLDMFGNSTVSDLSPLALLTALRNLDLYGNRLADVHHISQLVGLTHLSLAANNLSSDDITSLSSLTVLASLDIWDNGLADIGPLAALATLECLDIRMNDGVRCGSGFLVLACALIQPIHG